LRVRRANFSANSAGRTKRLCIARLNDNHARHFGQLSNDPLRSAGIITGANQQ
jgi:hypothetical protein